MPKKFYLPLILLLSALCLVYIFPVALNDWLFVEIVYPAIRWMQNIIFGLLPFPAFLLLGTLLLIYLIKWLFNLLTKRDWKKGIIDLCFLLIICSAAFFWFWGIHYGSSSTTLHIDTKKVTITIADLERTIREASDVRSQIISDTDSFNIEWPENIYASITANGRKWVSAALEDFQLPHLHAANNIRSWPEGWLLMWGVAGIYFPFTGEPGIDKGLHALKMPHTALHEWAHSHGYTGEGDCNLIAYLASIHSQEPFIIYSAILQRLKDEMYVLAATDYKSYQSIKENMPDAIKTDLASIRKHHNKYRRSFTDAGEWINDHYLKTLGVEDGVDNYLKWVLQLKVLESSGSE